MTESNTRGLERDPTDSSTAPGSISNAVPTDSHATDLTQFQLNTLTLLGTPYELGISLAALAAVVIGLWGLIQ